MIIYDVLAERILDFYTLYKSDFNNSCMIAKTRFEKKTWTLDPATTSFRIKLYNDYLEGLNKEIIKTLPQVDVDSWLGIKQAYENLLHSFAYPEHARTFFNSIARFYFYNTYNGRDIYFELIEDENRMVSTKKFTINHSTKHTSSFFSLLAWNVTHQNLIYDTTALQHMAIGTQHKSEVVFEFYEELFYRNKKAYLLGRFLDKENPVAVAIKFAQTNEGVFIEEILKGEDKVKKAFEFTRSYFWVNTEDPVALVNYLLTLMPSKPREQLFINIGYIKHGKSVQYHHLMKALSHPTAQMVVAPGVRGLVMQVFTLPDYHLVFKMIKDKCSPPKNVTKNHVKNRYQFVGNHDRVGRIADTQEYHHFKLDKKIFEPNLLADLLAQSSEEVTLVGDSVVLRHFYLERKMVPLDIYIQQNADRKSVEAIIDYGNAIKELAEANIFPGDLLIKNFGVTSDGKVIFYDYDEIVKVTECNFRVFPEYDDDDDMDYYSAEPAYHVAPEDIFPQEFEKFLIPNGILKDVFLKNHGELFTQKYWQELKDRILDSEI